MTKEDYAKANSLLCDIHAYADRLECLVDKKMTGNLNALFDELNSYEMFRDILTQHINDAYEDAISFLEGRIDEMDNQFANL